MLCNVTEDKIRYKRMMNSNYNLLIWFYFDSSSGRSIILCLAFLELIDHTHILPLHMQAICQNPKISMYQKYQEARMQNCKNIQNSPCTKTKNQKPKTKNQKRKVFKKRRPTPTSCPMKTFRKTVISCINRLEFKNHI